jgi:hypothetical protein
MLHVICSFDLGDGNWKLGVSVAGIHAHVRVRVFFVIFSRNALIPIDFDAIRVYLDGRRR